MKQMVAMSVSMCLALVAVGPVAAAPAVDGKLDPADGYTVKYKVPMLVQGQTKDDPLIVADPGTLWLYQDPVTEDVFLHFSQPVTLVDNTYGATSIGWGKEAPSGKNHNFDDLVNSDDARFVFTDKAGNVVLDITVDYISKSGGSYRTLGVTGGEGKVHSGSASSVLAVGTSLDYNFNTLGHVLTKDSPATDTNYTENPNYPGWIWEVAYELQIDGSLFRANGFGGVTIPLVHDSPNKIGKNKVYTPEPATMGLLALGCVPMLFRRRRK